MGKYLNSRSNQFITCHVCGTDVPRGRRSCPDCGADENTGLHGDDSIAVAGISEDPEFDYDDFLRREFGSGSSKVKPPHLSWIYWVGGILCLAALVWYSIISFLL
jgi:hypothetical protein